MIFICNKKKRKLLITLYLYFLFIKNILKNTKKKNIFKNTYNETNYLLIKLIKMHKFSVLKIL